MSDIAIKVENLSKMYKLGDIGTGSLGTDITSWWARVRGKEDPNSKIAIANDRSQKATSDYVWSLQNLDFEIKKGDAVGIIGKNGAGKSTLLKILSRTTAPTTGSIKIKGRVASLLEVGTGFHADLSGKENIYMNGAILGMTRREITTKLDEIIDFSGVAGYIDTPVKRYSSGMYVRLAFAVAAHLDPDILIVDEVLAVGDAEFQKKCLGKMQDVNNHEGRTVLFVSHQLGTLAQLCNKTILLRNGQLVNFDVTSKIIAQYMESKSDKNSNVYTPVELNNEKAFQFIEILTTNEADSPIEEYGFKDSIHLSFKIKINKFLPETKIGIALQDRNQNSIFTIHKDIKDFSSLDELNKTRSFRVKLPCSLIAPNTYSFIFAIFIPGQNPIEYLENICLIKIHDTGTEYAQFEGLNYGYFIVKSEWESYLN